MAYAYLYKVREFPLANNYENEVKGYVPCYYSDTAFSPGEVQKELNRIAKPIIAGTVNMTVPYNSPLAGNLRGEMRVKPIYFGNMLDTQEVIPPPRLMSTEKWREKAKSRAKDWEQQKKRGDIVFKPLKTGSFTAVSNPGLDVVYQSSTQRVGFNRDMATYLPLYDGPCNFGTNRMAMPGGKARLGMTCQIRVEMDKIYFRDARFLYLEDLYPGLKEAIASFVKKISPQYEVNFDRGLSTSVICEANAGAWDIATEVAEALRETIPSIIDACAHIIRKYLEVRKKIKTLRKNSISEGSLKADIASLWLNFRYGIGPLAYSIQDGLAYLEYQQQRYQTYRDGVTKTYNFEHDDLVGSVKVTHRCVVRDLFDPALLGRYNTSGLKINFYDTAWQLLPASFIIDWVLNVGDVLTTLVSPDGLKDRKWMYSVRCNDTLVITSPRLPGGSVVVDIDCYTASTSVREPVGLQFNPNMNPKRWLDALAIFWGGVKKPLRYH